MYNGGECMVQMIAATQTEYKCVTLQSPKLLCIYFYNTAYSKNKYVTGFEITHL